MKLKRILSAAAFLLLAVCLTACGDDPAPADTTAPPPATTAAPIATKPQPTPAATPAAPVTTVPPPVTTTAPPVTSAPQTTAPAPTAPLPPAPAPTELIDAANAALFNRREPYSARLTLGFHSQSALINFLLPELDMYGEQAFDGENADIAFTGLGRTARLILYGDSAYVSLPAEEGESTRYRFAVDEEGKRTLLATAVTLPATDLAAFASVKVTQGADATAVTCTQVDPLVLATLNEALDELEAATADMGLSYTATAVTTVFTLLPDGSYQSITLTVNCDVRSRDIPFATLPATVTLSYVLDYEAPVCVAAPEDAGEYLPKTLDEIKKELTDE